MRGTSEPRYNSAKNMSLRFTNLREHGMFDHLLQLMKESEIKNLGHFSLAFPHHRLVEAPSLVDHLKKINETYNGRSSDTEKNII